MTAPATRRPPSSDKMAALLETVALSDFQKRLLRERWLDQVGWMSEKARRERRWYYRLRVPVVIGGVAIPGLVSLVITTASEPGLEWVRWFTFGLSVLVAMLAALEEIFHFGDRWRHYRQNAETLKSLGWQFLMLNGAFSRYADHAAAFKPFTTRVEEILTDDVEGYLGMTEGDSSGGRHDIVS